jgi:signal recognition particle subunit SRP68
MQCCELGRQLRLRGRGAGAFGNNALALSRIYCTKSMAQVRPEDREEGDADAVATPGGYELDVLKVIKDAQDAHGLRNRNYQRYRQYCARRLRRLRTATNVKSMSKKGDKRFSKKKITPEMVNDPRFLLVSLVSAERDWAHAMELRELSDSSKHSGRVKHHMMRRLSKASVWARIFMHICGKVATSQTALEAKAYHDYICGVLALENEEWHDALRYLNSVQVIYESLAKIVSPAQQKLCMERLDEIQPSTRYCRFSLAKQAGSSVDSDDIASLQSAMSASGSDMLRSKLSAVLSETLKKQADSLDEVEWLGKKLTVRSPAARQHILSARHAAFQLASCSDREAKMSLFDAVLLSYEGASDALAAEAAAESALKDKDKSLKNEAAAAATKALSSYVSFQKIQTAIDRDSSLLAAAHETRSQLPGSKAASSLDSKKSNIRSILALQERIIQQLDESLQVPDLHLHAPTLREQEGKLTVMKGLRVLVLCDALSDAEEFAKAAALLPRAILYRDRASHALKDLSSAEAAAALAELSSGIKSKTALLRAAHARTLPEPGEDAGPAPASSTPASGLTLIESLDTYVCRSRVLVAMPP